MSGAPIRVRLTAWYVLVLAAVLVALVAFVVTRLRSDLTSEVDRSLRSAASQIVKGYRLEGAPEFRDVSNTVLPGPSESSGSQVLAPSGRVLLFDGDPVTAAPLIDQVSLNGVLSGGEILDSRQIGTPSEHLRVLAVPATRKGLPRVLVVTESLDEVDSSVDRVLVLLLVGGAAALGLLAIGGWWIARKALAPVERITTRADQIGIDDLSQRIATPRVEDEVGHLARTLNAMLERLEEGVASRQRLVADASHELRVPLAAMRAEIEVSLRHDELGDEAREVLASARDEVVRLGRIVDNLLTLARVDEGRLELLLAPEDLKELAEREARRHRAAAAAAGVEIVVEGEPVALEADRERLGQVLNNLIDNAIRFAPRGSAIQISVRRGETDAEVTVSDQGPGVPAETRERVFERFSREDPARGRSGGAGLGLAICREIVRAHGGRIWIEDGDPRGSSFVVALARADSEPTLEPSETEAPRVAERE